VGFGGLNIRMNNNGVRVNGQSLSRGQTEISAENTTVTIINNGAHSQVDDSDRVFIWSQN
jgi:hypothetical protein